MRKALTSIGSDVALVLDPFVRDALNLHHDDEVELELQNNALIVHPVVKLSRDVVAEAFRHVVNNPQEIESVKAAESEGMPPLATAWVGG
jgi:antitoxin component of MazEF toxin-antitoxin module